MRKSGINEFEIDHWRKENETTKSMLQFYQTKNLFEDKKLKWFCSERCLEEIVIKWKSQRKEWLFTRKRKWRHSNGKKQRGWTISVRKKLLGKRQWARDVRKFLEKDKVAEVAFDRNDFLLIRSLAALFVSFSEQHQEDHRQLRFRHTESRTENERSLKENFYPINFLRKRKKTKRLKLCRRVDNVGKDKFFIRKEAFHFFKNSHVA